MSLLADLARVCHPDAHGLIAPTDPEPAQPPLVVRIIGSDGAIRSVLSADDAIEELARLDPTLTRYVTPQGAPPCPAPMTPAPTTARPPKS